MLLKAKSGKPLPFLLVSSSSSCMDKLLIVRHRSLFDDKIYHSIYEALFRCTLLEKEAYFSGKKTTKASATTRLEKCAAALRLAVTHGASSIKRKTARAIIDHITQVLPGPEESYIEPLLKDYAKALSTFLHFSANVENLAAFSGESWEICVDFCIQALSRYLETSGSGRDTASLPRASPAPGTAQTTSSTYLTLRSSSSALRPGSVQIGGQMAVEFLSCLNSLVTAPNAPVQRRADSVSQIALQILGLRQMKLGGLQKEAFSTINNLFPRIQVDDVALSKTVAKALMPLLAHWWQPRSLSRDAMLNSIRDEMLRTIYGTHLYFESLVCESSDGSVLQDIEDLLEALWSRRDDRARLQLEDITFTGMALPDHHPSTGVFSLRPYNQAGEQNWALLENIALLEAIYSRNSHRARDTPQLEEDQPQPRKRRRMANSLPNRIHQKFSSIDPAVRLTAMQLVPFLARQKRPSLDDVKEAMADLLKCINAKQGTVASWAMLACSRYV